MKTKCETTEGLQSELSIAAKKYGDLTEEFIELRNERDELRERLDLTIRDLSNAKNEKVDVLLQMVKIVTDNIELKTKIDNGIRVRAYGLAEPWRFFKTSTDRATATVILD